MFIAFLRQFKIGPFAIFDTVISYVGIYLLAPLFIKLFAHFHVKTTVVTWLWLTLPVAIFFHIIFSQHTPLTKMFLDPSQFIIAKVVIVGMLVMGVRSVIVANQ